MELEELIHSIKMSRSVPTEEDLRGLPHKRAFIYGRVSTQGQVKDSRESIREVAKLVDIAKKDGYQSDSVADTVGNWLDSIQNGEEASRTMEEGDITIDCRDLGLSGSLGEDKRPGLKALWKGVETGEIGAVYLTEGMSRLSRDRDRVLGYKLLRLLKQQKCRIRTPEGVYNPGVPRDWDYLADDIEDSAEEMKKMGIRLGRRRISKATEGRHVGNPVSPGYTVTIEGQRRDGSYILGKWEPYPPHQTIVVQILEEVVKQQSLHRAALILNEKGVVFPFFPESLKYMETRSALRQYLRNDNGYRITSHTLRGLATNIKLIGIWEYKDILIKDNHPAIIPTDLFLRAYEIALTNKPRGRAVYSEPMEWSELLYCYNHDEPRQLSANNSRKQWACNYDYKMAQGPRCLYVEDHILTKPLTREVLNCLDLTPHAQAVLEKLRQEIGERNVEESRNRRKEVELKNRIANLERYLGLENPEREETYWRLINETKAELESISKRNPLPKGAPIDIDRVTEFLGNLEENWQKCPSRFRNRLLKLLIDRVELRHDQTVIDAAIFWKVGLEQRIKIKRPSAHFTKEKRWQPEEDKLLTMLWPSSSREAVIAAFPARSWGSISERASRLKLKRQWMRNAAKGLRIWTSEDEAYILDMYTNGAKTHEIARKLGRTERAILGRASLLGIHRPKGFYPRKVEAVWSSENINVIQESTSRSVPWSHW